MMKIVILMYVDYIWIFEIENYLIIWYKLILCEYIFILYVLL